MKRSDPLAADRATKRADPLAAEALRAKPDPLAGEASRAKRADPLAAVAVGDLLPLERPRAVQYFSDEYLERCRRLSARDIVRFLEEFRLNYATAESARRQKRP